MKKLVIPNGDYNLEFSFEPLITRNLVLVHCFDGILNRSKIFRMKRKDQLDNLQNLPQQLFRDFYNDFFV